MNKKVLSLLIAIAMVMSMLTGVVYTPKAIADVSSVSVNLSTNVAGKPAAYKINFTPSATLDAGGYIYIVFPKETGGLGSSIAASNITVDGFDCPADATVKENSDGSFKVTVTTPFVLTADESHYVYFRSGAGIVNPTKAAGYTIVVSTSEEAGGSDTYTINPDVATKLTLTASPEYFSSESVTLTVGLADQYGNDCDSPEDDTWVTFTSTVSDGTFDPSSINLRTTSTTTYTQNSLGDATITASASGYESASVTVHKVLGITLTIDVESGGDFKWEAGKVSDKLYVQADQTLSSPLSVQLKSDSSTAKFYSDEECTEEITSVILPAGVANPEAYFYLRDTKAAATTDPHTITASATYVEPATRTYTIDASTPVKLWMSDPPTGTKAGEDSTAITVKLQDAYGNDATAGSDVTVTLSDGDAGGAFYCYNTSSSSYEEGNTLTIPSGSGSSTFEYSNNTAGTYTLTARATGFVSASKQITIVSNVANKIVFKGLPQVFKKDTFSKPITVEIEDGYGNPTKPENDTVVTLSDGGGNGKFYTDVAGSPVTSIVIPKTDSSAVIYYKNSNVNITEGYELTASATSLDSATGKVWISSSTPKLVLSVLTVIDDVSYVQINSATNVTVILKDGDDTIQANNLKVTGSWFTNNYSLSNGTVTIPFTGTEIGTVNLSASVDTASGSLAVDVVHGKIVPSLTSLSLIAGAESSNLSPTLKTLGGSSIFATSDVALTVEGSETGVFNPASPVIPMGSSSVDLTYKDTKATDEAYEIVISAPGWAPCKISVSVSAADYDHLAFTETPTNPVRKGCEVSFKVTAYDEYGNVCKANGVGSGNSLYWTDGNSINEISSCTDGVYSFNYTPSETGTITIKVATGASGQSNFDFTTATDVKTFDLEVVEFAITTDSALPDATVNEYYSKTLEVQGVLPGETVKWSLYSGSLPEGLALDPANGTIYGYPTTAGNYAFTIEAKITDTDPEIVDYKTFTLKVATPPAPTVPKYIKLLSPMQGDIYAPNDTIQVQWDVNGFDGSEGYIRIFFFNGKKWTLVKDGINLADGSYDIHLTDYTIVDPYRVRVRVGIYDPETGAWLTWTNGVYSGQWYAESGHFWVTNP